MTYQRNETPEPLASEERDLAHEADMEEPRREQLQADCGGEMADDEDALMGDPDEYDDDWGDECYHCGGDGRDPYTDYLMPCPACQGSQMP